MLCFTKNYWSGSSPRYALITGTLTHRHFRSIGCLTVRMHTTDLLKNKCESITDESTVPTQLIVK